MPESFQSDYEGPEESPGFLLWQTTNLWQRRQRAALKEVDLTHVQFVLLASVVWLTSHGRTVTQIDLARHAATDVMMTSQVLRTLEGKGLVTRLPHPDDSRAKHVLATERGEETAARAIRIVEGVDRAFFAAGSEDAHALTAVLQRILERETAGTRAEGGSA